MKIRKIAISFLFLAACSSGDEYEKIIVKENEFQKDITVTGEYVETTPVPICPENILIIDSLLIIKNGYMCDDTFFYVYNKNNKNFLGSFGERGRGPNEFLNLNITGQYIKNNNSISLWGRERSRFELVNITSSIETNKIVIDDNFSGHGLNIQPIYAFVLPSGDICGTAMSNEGRLFYFKEKDESVSWVEYFPKVNKLPFEEDMIHNLYIGPTKINPDNSKIVSALELFKRIDVFNSETDHLFSLVFNDSPENPDFFINPNNPIPSSLMHYYYDLFLSEKYIYAMVCYCQLMMILKAK